MNCLEIRRTQFKPIAIIITDRKFRLKITMKMLLSIVGLMVLMMISTGFCKTLKSGILF